MIDKAAYAFGCKSISIVWDREFMAEADYSSQDGFEEDRF